MVEKQLESEVKEILGHIKNGNNFLLSGGAGSGKTYSMVQLINQLITEYPTEKIACITYTNAATNEIKHRVQSDNLYVSTIHDFLWDSIKTYQKDLIIIFKEFINKNTEKERRLQPKDKYLSDDELSQITKIEYKEFDRLSEGKISHDNLLKIASKFYERYPKLCKIIQQKYKFIFVDEYQDTDKEVIDIFLRAFTTNKIQGHIIGFFGDAMQSIYDTGVGNLNDYSENIKEVKKVQNRRNPQKIIDLSNKIRTDGLIQEASDDSTAPNMQDGIIKQGNIQFLYCDKALSPDCFIEKIKVYLKWDFSDSKNTKELYLTHNLIASKAGYENLFKIYDKDPVMDLYSALKEKHKIKPLDDINNQTFETVALHFDLKNRQKQSKKDILANEYSNEYTQIKDIVWQDMPYFDKDKLMDTEKQNAFIKTGFKVCELIFLYEDKQYNDFIKKTHYQIKVLNDKKILKQHIEEIKTSSEDTIENVINKAISYNLIKIDDKYQDFITKQPYLYSRIKDIKFKEIQALFKFLEEKTPFSTQHKTKGSEFDNVLVMLESNWNKYNFESLFSLTKSADSVLIRTKKLFYVCITRAKENLAIAYYDPTKDVIAKAQEWFGQGNCISVHAD